MAETFREKFCRHYGVAPERYGEDMLRRTLYAHARRLRWILSHDVLSADRIFIESVGRLTRRSDFPGEVMEFRDDARNLTFWRHRLRLRVSCTRMRALFREAWPAPADTPPL